MADDLNTIVLRGKGHYDEGEADAAISPGEAVRLAADGNYDPETIAASLVGQRGLAIALEDALQGNTVDDAYADGDRLFLYFPVPGDIVQVLAKAGEDIDVGDFLSVEGAGSGKFVEVAAASTYGHTIPLSTLRTWDAMATNLPGAAANDDLAYITGTPGTDAPTVQAADSGGASPTQKAAFEFVLPETYRAGSAVTLRVKAGVLTTVFDTSLTLDASAYLDAGDGTVGSDLVTTAAQSINSLTMANKDFTITPTGLVPGDRLLIVLTVAGVDSGDAGVMIPEIQAIDILTGNAPAGQLIALEDSGGALASATLIKCRVL